MTRRILLGLALGAATVPAVVRAQQAGGPQFDVVSIKQNVGGRAGGPLNQRPDGGLTMIHVPIGLLIARAYPGHIPAEMIGLPDWAMREYYDVRTTSSLTSATADDRAAMMRSMLADRCKLVAHVEQREQDAYEIVLARKDGTLGRGLTKSDADCSQPAPAPLSRPDFSAPPPPCTLRIVGAPLRPSAAEPGDLLEGEAPIARIGDALRPTLRRPVVDKTGLAGTYRVRLTFDMRAMLRLDVTPSADAAPSLFTAIQEQLGLKLQSTRLLRDTLIIDRIERPTPN
jgi:uncharacterized protein (TIGR03435 family)